VTDPAQDGKTAARTLFDKVWDGHVVRAETADTPAVLYVDLHLLGYLLSQGEAIAAFEGARG
jgi:hypothetical protein